MNRQHSVRVAAAVFAVTLASGLTACAGPQSVADACAVVNPVATELSAVGTSLDPADAASKLKDVQSKVTNDQVKPLVDKLVVYMSDAASANSTSLGGLSQAVEAMSAVSSLDQLCHFQGQ